MKEIACRARYVVDFLKKKGLYSSNKEIATKMKYNSQSLSQRLNGKYKITDEFISRLCALHPGLNASWIKTGEGEMLKEIDFTSEENVKLIPGYIKQTMSIVSSTMDIQLSMHIRHAHIEKTILELKETLDQLHLRLDKLETAAITSK